MADPLPLQIQSLGSYRDQTLVLLHVSQLRNPDGTASPSEIGRTFLELRLPPPSNVSQHLSGLANDGTVMQPANGRWSVTPKGEKQIRTLMAGINPEDLQRMSTLVGEPSFGNIPHHLLPSEFAPAQFQPAISAFLEGHPFDRNVLCVTRFPEGETDPVGPAIEACRSACSGVSLEMHLASDRAVEDILFGNVAAALWASRYGIAIFEDTADKGINYNVVFEVGAMLMTGRRCLLLKDQSVERLPTDLVGHIYQSVDLHDPDAVAAEVTRWAGSDLGL